MLEYCKCGCSVTADFQIPVFQDIEYIQSHYNIEDFINFNHHKQEEHGHLYHFVLNPVFHHYTRHFLKETLRLGHKSSLYYPVYPQDVEGKVRGKAVAFLMSNVVIFAHFTFLFASLQPSRGVICLLPHLFLGAVCLLRTHTGWCIAAACGTVSPLHTCAAGLIVKCLPSPLPSRWSVLSEAVNTQHSLSCVRAVSCSWLCVLPLCWMYRWRSKVAAHQLRRPRLSPYVVACHVPVPLVCFRRLRVSYRPGFKWQGIKQVSLYLAVVCIPCHSLITEPDQVLLISPTDPRATTQLQS